MKLQQWSYMKRNHIKAQFDLFPQSVVVFCRIKQYFFVHNVIGHSEDHPVQDHDLELMEFLLNEEMGTDRAYMNRRSLKII
jgi:hypothetical protein